MSEEGNKVFSLVSWMDEAYHNHGILPNKKHTADLIIPGYIYSNPHIVSRLGLWIAECFEANSIQAVASPASEEILLAQSVALHLEELDINRDEVVLVPCRKRKVVFKRQFSKSGDLGRKRVLIIRDILYDGDSTQQLIDLVRSRGGNIIGLGSIANYGDIRFEVLVQHSLFSRKVGKENCPMCEERKRRER